MLKMMKLLSWRRAMFFWWVLLDQVWSSFLYLVLAFPLLIVIMLSCDNSKLIRLLSSFSYFSLTIRIGKTLLAKTLARIVNVPFTITDATALTQASSLVHIVFQLSFLYVYRLVVTLISLLSWILLSTFVFLMNYLFCRISYWEKKKKQKLVTPVSSSHLVIMYVLINHILSVHVAIYV